MLTPSKRLATSAATAVVMAGALISTSAGAAQAQEYGDTSAFGVLSSLTDAAVGPVPLAEYPAGPTSAFLATQPIGPYGNLTSLSAEADGEDGTVTATGEVGSTSLVFEEDPVTSEPLTTLTAGLISATCTAGPNEEPTGSAILSTAVYTSTAGTEAFPTVPAANTNVPLPGGVGTAHLNEQIPTPEGGLTVNALRLELTEGPVTGQLTIGSVTCNPGGVDEEEPEEEGTIVPTALDAETGAPVDNVVFAAFDDLPPNGGGPAGIRALSRDTLRAQPPSSEGECVTDNSGTCEITDLEPGEYVVCVVDVPEGYKPPRRHDRCVGPETLQEGEYLELDPVYLHPDRKDKGRK